MKTPLRGMFVGVPLALTVLCLAGSGTAGGGKETGWKAFLPEADQRELAGRAARDLQEVLAEGYSEEAAKRAQFLALTLAGFARSGKAGAEAKRATTYQAGLQVATLLKTKAKWADAKKLAAALDKLPAGATATFAGDLKMTGIEVAELMEHYKTKKNGGEGLPAVLQSSLKLKGVQGNGIEEKIRALAMKKLLQALVEKESEELALLAYRAAVVGELVYQFAPAKKVGMKDPAEWRQYSLAMRDAGIELAEAARKKDAEAVFKAGNRLNSSCSQCHSTFRLGK